MSIGVLAAFLGYLTNFFDPVQQLSQLYSTFLSAVAALDKIKDVLVEEPEVEDAGRGRARRTSSDTSASTRPLRLRDGPEVLHGSTSTCRPG